MANQFDMWVPLSDPLLDTFQFQISVICYSLAVELVVFCDFRRKLWFWSSLARNLVVLGNLLEPGQMGLFLLVH